MTMASSVANSKLLVGQLCEIGDLISPLLESSWKTMEVQIYQNNTNYVIRHTGVKITLISINKEDGELVFTLDWGQDQARIGKLQVAVLRGEDLLKHSKENTLLVSPLRISLQAESIRFQLVHILSEMWECFKRITYNVTMYDPSGTEMNCRGFCSWLMDKLRILQSSDCEVTKAKDKIDGVEKTDKLVFWSSVGTVAATALLGSSALLAKSGCQESKK